MKTKATFDIGTLLRGLFTNRDKYILFLTKSRAVGDENQRGTQIILSTSSFPIGITHLTTHSLFIHTSLYYAPHLVIRVLPTKPICQLIFSVKMIFTIYRFHPFMSLNLETFRAKVATQNRQNRHFAKFR